jgi:hypothetical protein
LIDIGGQAAFAEVFAERSVPHQNNLVGVRLFVLTRATATDMATVIAHADQRAIVQRMEPE